MTIRISATPATVRHLRDLRGATGRLNRNMAFQLTRAMDDQRRDLLRRWRMELRTVRPYTSRGLRWDAVLPARTMIARLYLSQAVYRYMQFHIRGGTRRFRRGQIVYLPGTPVSVRGNFADPRRFEIPLESGSNIVLLRRQGGNRVLGFRIFRADYQVRASSERYIARRLPMFIEVRINESFEQLRNRISG